MEDFQLMTAFTVNFFDTYLAIQKRQATATSKHVSCICWIQIHFTPNLKK